MEIPVGGVSWARHVAVQVLDRLPGRWAHTQAVAAAAGRWAVEVRLDRADYDRVVAAAYLHDIGYGLGPQTCPGFTGWHPLDGAVWLRNRYGLGDVADLVAWHTTAEEEAVLLGHRAVLEAQFARPAVGVADVVTFADMTTGPDGSLMTFDQRRAEVRARRGEGSTAVAAMTVAWPRLRQVRARVLQRRHGTEETG